MSAIFISNSSKDNAWAERIATWLKELGHESLFLDFDPENGIPAGSDWEKDLHHQLRRCRAVIALLSEHFITSDWCKGEVWIGSHQGKSIFPLQIGPCELPQILRGFQAIDLTTDPEDGLRRLGLGLAKAGLDPRNLLRWDSNRPPYPGLMAFQEADAAVFFGRDQEIQEGLDRLHNLRRYGGKALLMVLGASGCGKSSLVRAGLLPRLRRDPQNWLVLDPFRPGADPFGELAHALAKAFRVVAENPPPRPATVQEFNDQVEDLKRHSGQREATTVIVIDQFEELLAVDKSNSVNKQGSPDEGAFSQESKYFLAVLRDIAKKADGYLVLLASLRSDFLPSLQCHPSLVGVPLDDLKLGPMEAPSYARVIEGPAEVAGLILEPGLTERMVADTRTGDALPLLAFTLREMWERYGKDGDLTLTEYEHLGGLEGSVRRAADGILGSRPLSTADEKVLRRAFLQMCRINEEGQHARTTARWETTPPGSRETLERFVEARLLVSGKGSGTIEVAHEALLRTWPLLKGWLEQSREYLLWRTRFQGALEEYQRSGTLLAGKPLDEAERWKEETAEGSSERRLIEASVSAHRVRKMRTRVLVGAAGAAVAVVTAGLWWQLHTISKLESQSILQTHQQLVEADPLESVVHGMAALRRSINSDDGRSIEIIESLARAIQNNFAISRLIPSGQDGVMALIRLNNGELISGGSDGTLQRWRDGKPLGQPIPTGQPWVASLIELKNGELVSGGSDGTLRRWRDGEPLGETIRTGQEDVTCLIELKSGELVSGSRDGTLRRWRNGMFIGEPIDTKQNGVTSVTELMSGELITGGNNGTLQYWDDAMSRGTSINTDQDSVTSLIELKNGDLISAGRDGTLQRWRDGKPVGAKIQTDQKWVTSLVEGANGELISADQYGYLRYWRHSAHLPDSKPIPTEQGSVVSLLELKNGEVVSGGKNGTLRRWLDGRPVEEGRAVATGGEDVTSIFQLQDGVLITSGFDGILRSWKGWQPIGNPIRISMDGMTNLLLLKNGDLISADIYGSLRRWRRGSQIGPPIKTNQGAVTSLVESKNGEIVSGGMDGSLRRWLDNEAIGEKLKTPHSQPVLRLVELRSGELISGASDGTLQRWRNFKTVGQLIKTEEGPVLSLLELKNGQLISGGSFGILRRWRDGKAIGGPIKVTNGHLEKSGFALSRHEHKKAAQRRLGKNPCGTS